MAQPSRTATSGTFFITAITLNRRRRFQVDATARLFIETLQHYRAAGSYKLFAFVVMPDHVHLLLQTDDISKSIKEIKGGFTHRFSPKQQFWQRGFTDHLILDRADFDTPSNTHIKIPSATTSPTAPKRTPTPPRPAPEALHQGPPKPRKGRVSDPARKPRAPRRFLSAEGRSAGVAETTKLSSSNPPQGFFITAITLTRRHRFQPSKPATAPASAE